jgi:hypothetical protein
MSPSENPAVQRYDNLLASARGLTETHGKKVVLFIPKADITRIDLRFGRSGHRPLLTFLLGAILVPIGIYGVVDLFLRPAGLRYEMAMAAFGLIGGSLIFDTLKQRYFLEVSHGGEISRLIFSKNAAQGQVREFCARATETHGYAITDQTMETGGPERH